jgi:hypothetical protein
LTSGGITDKDSPQQAEYGDRRPVARLDDGQVAARSFGRKIGRLEDVLLPLENLDDLGALVDMVSQRDAIHACGNQLVVNLWSDSRPAGRVLRIGDNQIEALALDKHRQRADDDLPPRFAHNIADEEDPHV